MSELEERLRDLGARVDAQGTSPAFPSEATLKRIRTRQRITAFSWAGVGVALVAALLIWGPPVMSTRFGPSTPGVTNGGGGEGGVNGVIPSPSPLPPGWVLHHSRLGVTIAAPKDWFFEGEAHKGRIPHIDFALGAWRFPTGTYRCQPRVMRTVSGSPTIPRMGMFLYMQEWNRRFRFAYGRFKRRPASFRLGPLKGPFECIGVKTHNILFAEHHRYFQIIIKFGRDAPERLRAQVIQSLNSMTIAPR